MSRWPATALVVGGGRAGTSFARLLASHGVRTTLHSRTRRPRIRGLSVASGAVPGPAPFELVVLAVPDRAVGAVAQALAPGSGRRTDTVIHLAGALSLEPLQPARDKGFRTGSMHPLQSIATPDTPLDRTPTGIAGDTDATRRALVSLAKRLGLVPLQPNGARAAYHAAACIAGNYPQVLVEASLRLFAQAGLGRKDALRAVERLAQSGLGNALAKGPAQGLTGPVARGEAATVAGHLHAIDDADVRALYVAAGRIALQLAKSRGVDVRAAEDLLRDA